MLYATAKKDRKNWDEVIWKVEMGLRSSKNFGTGYTPFEVIYGFLPKLDSYFSFSEIKMKNSSEIQQKIRLNNIQNEQINQQYKPKFKVGEKVMIRSSKTNIGINDKRFFGPGIIEKLTNYKSYLIRIDGKSIRRHEDHLKHFYEESNSISEISTSVISRKNEHSVELRYPQRTRQHIQRYGFNL